MRLSLDPPARLGTGRVRRSLAAARLIAGPALLAVSVPLAIFAAPAGAQTPSPSPAATAPVALGACRGGIASIELVEIAAYDVTLRNTAALPADEIKLSVRYGRRRKTAAFDLRGTFAPGVDVTRHLRRTVGAGLYSYASDSNDCSVDYVHFSDGTSWSAPPRT
jgi:hypothetical protein